MISPLDAGIVFVAGIGAGLVGTGGAIASLVSYPALLAIGLPALTANVTNIVALVACWPGSALTSGPELRGRRPWLRRFLPVTAVGGVAGALLLQSTPPGVFERVVPLLIATGALTLLAQPRITARRTRRSAHRRAGSRAREPLLGAALFVVAAYSGYFGAGSGVLTMAMLLVAVDDHLPTANALKNATIGAATATAAVVLTAIAPVRWSAAAPLAAGTFLGAMLGPHIARRLHPRILRPLVAAVGLGLALQLWLHVVS